MRCLVVYGSPRKGNSWRVVQLIKDELLRLGSIEFDEVMLSDMDIPLCRGCHMCFIRGEEKCPHSQVVQEIAGKVEKADCLIVSSPVYVLSLSGLLKNWLDHMGFNWHRPRYFTKKALVVTTTAGAGAYGTARYVRDNLKHWGFNKVYSLPIACRSLDYEPAENARTRIRKISQAFYNDVASGKLHPPTPKRVFFFNVWRANGAVGEPDSADSRYWRESGLESRLFAPDLAVSPINRVMGSLTYSMFKKAMRP